MFHGLEPLIEQYRQHGPIWKQMIGGRLGWVLAGPAANVFLAEAGDRIFSSRPFFTPFVRQLDTSDFVVAMDGAPHRAMRGTMKGSFTREAIADAVPIMVATTREMVGRWQRGERVEMVRSFRRTITEQLAQSMMHRAAGGDWDTVAEFFDTLVGGAISRTRPAGVLESPEYLDAKARVFGIMREVIAERRLRGPREVPDYIDHLIAGRDEHGRPLKDDVLLAASMVPFFAGIDTVANTCSFLLYELFKHPRLLERVTAEADAAFAGGELDARALRSARWLHGAAMETMRVYPVAPAAMRYVTESFEFAGQVVERGQMVMIATPLAHFLPELWPEPYTFDPERFWEPRNEHRRPGAYAPFFKGPHTCIGAALGEMQLMVTLATLLHHARLALDPPNHQIQLVVDPIMTARGGYRVLVLDTRAPREAWERQESIEFSKEVAP